MATTGWMRDEPFEKWGLRGPSSVGRVLNAATEGGTSDASDPLYGFYIFMVLLCLALAALASGLTQGLLSLDITELHIKSESGTPTEKKYSKAILPIRLQHHLILVTFMLWNAMANEALPIFLGKLVNEYVAIAISVTCVLFVGEIIPAAILTGMSVCISLFGAPFHETNLLIIHLSPLRPQAQAKCATPTTCPLFPGQQSTPYTPFRIQ